MKSSLLPLEKLPNGQKFESSQTDWCEWSSNECWSKF